MPLRSLPLIVLVMVCASCTPTCNTSDPIVTARCWAELGISTQQAVSTQIAAAPVTQSYLEAEYEKSLTATALPPQQTATQQALQLADFAITQAWDNRTATAVAQTIAYSQTAIALVKIDSDAQARVAENNRKIAEETYRANSMQFVYYGCAGSLVFVFVAGALIALFYFQKGAVTVHQTFERRQWDKVEEDHAKKLFELGLAPSSIGPILLSQPSAPALADKHLEKFHHTQTWRTACKKLVEHGVIAGQGGAKHPFSETTLIPFVSRPDSGKVWVDGYRKISDVLQANNIWYVAGPRIAPEWGSDAKGIWNWDRFEREFDLTPLHSLPDGNPPDVKTPAWSFAVSA